MLFLLARRWRTQRITPAPNLTGYWNADKGAIFDLAGLTDSAQTTQGPYWFDASPPARLCLSASLKLPIGSPGFYFAVQAVSAQGLCLALWMPDLPNGSYSHRLTYELVPLDE